MLSTPMQMSYINTLKKHYLALTQYISSKAPEAIKPYIGKYGLAIPLAAVVLLIVVTLLFFQSKLFEVDETPDFGELPDFSTYTDVKQMKADFYDYLQPMVAYHNSQVLAQREQLQALYTKLKEGGSLRSGDKEFILALADQYDYDLTPGWDEEIADNIKESPFHSVYKHLLLRVDEIPVALALVQAAKESGWGRSRFAVEGNNLFGQWCYTTGCGIVPGSRTSGASHEVKKFESVAEAVASYINNLNSHRSYKTLRLIRAGLRSSEDPVGGMDLADGLINYSERRQAYVDEVKSMIRQYRKFQKARQSVN